MLYATGGLAMDETLWHKCRSPIIPRRTVDGGWTSFAQTWRRKNASGNWEYSQDRELFEDWVERQF